VGLGEAAAGALGQTAPATAFAGNTGPEDRLAPSPNGQVLRRVEWTRPWLLLPPGARGCLVPLTIAAGLAMITGAAMTASLSPEFVVWLYGAATLPMAAAPMLVERRLRHLAERRPLSVSVAPLRRGEVVKVRGRVRAGETFETAGLRRPAVLASYAGTVTYVTGHITDGLSRPLHETRGVDFSVDLESGERVVVRTRNVYFLSQPPETKRLFWGRNMQGLPTPLRRLSRVEDRGAVTEVILGESNLCPGDEVEVVGVLDHEVSPIAAAAGRGARLQAVLRSGTLTPLLVRRVHDGDDE
jgi:hypothetical protein